MPCLCTKHQSDFFSRKRWIWNLDTDLYESPSCDIMIAPWSHLPLCLSLTGPNTLTLSFLPWFISEHLQLISTVLRVGKNGNSWLNLIFEIFQSLKSWHSILMQKPSSTWKSMRKSSFLFLQWYSYFYCPSFSIRFLVLQGDFATIIHSCI